MNENYSDQKLLELCNEYGAQALLWRAKFIGLLPEVAKRRLFERAGCMSIFEFAKKKAGLSEKQVRLALNLSERFEDKPVLRELLVDGKVGLNKLARVASVATTENQEFWAEQVKILPKKSLETLVRDERFAAKNDLHDSGELLPGQNLAGDLANMAIERRGIELSSTVCTRLEQMKNKGVNVDELLMKLLDQHESEIAERKEEIAEEVDRSPEPAGRYIPAKVRNILRAEFGTKCVIPHCLHTATSIHHTARFALSKSHNPHYMAPLCKAHHDIAHSIDGKVRALSAADFEKSVDKMAFGL